MGTGPNLRALTGPAAQGARAVATPLAVLAVSVVVDRIGRRLADLPVDRLDDASLTVAAVRSSPLVIGGGIAVLVAVAIAGRGRLLVRWSDLEHGRAQQVLVALCGGLLAWRYSTTAYDYLFGQWHTVDRVLLVVLALAAILRPVALLGLIPVVRIVRAPFLVPFAFSPAQNVDQLLLLVLAVIAAGFLVHAVSGRSVAPSVLGLTVAVVAMHFFVPGRAKLDLGWYGADDLDQLPLNGHAQGWLGAGDGAWARRLSRGFEASAPVLRAATVVLE
ncbi:MAG: hypothetical protein S0880_32170, partial [Actinomycetota bacterium]|nr:hypothetical protein [Actinomycetota bacterium]